MTGQRNRPGVGTEAIEALAGRLSNSSLPEFRPFDEVYEARLQGWSIGFHQRDGEITRLNFEADLWYWCYANKKRPSDWSSAATDRLWAEGVL